MPGTDEEMPGINVESFINNVTYQLVEEEEECL
jgi:hypothetical protein